MTAPKLYLDEDVRPLLADILQQRGYDVVSAIRLNHMAWSDNEHFEYAASSERAILTFNIRDFVPLALASITEEHTFSGLIVSHQLVIGELLRRTLRFLGQHTAEEIKNQVIWLSDYK